MLPIWPNTDRIPVWCWLLAIVVIVGGTLLGASTGLDEETVIQRLKQAIAAAVLGAGFFWAWHGGRTLLRLRALRNHGVRGEADVIDLWASSQRVERTGPFAVGSNVITQYFLIYRLTLPSGVFANRPMSIDSKLAKRLRKGGTVQVRYMPDRPKVSAPEDIAVGQVKVTRAIQLGAGLALIVWSMGWLAPGVLWPAG